MTTPESWREAAKRVLERENDPKTAQNGGIGPDSPENAEKRPETPGFAVSGYPTVDRRGWITDMRLIEVSLVKEPANPHARIIGFVNDGDQDP